MVARSRLLHYSVSADIVNFFLHSLRQGRQVAGGLSSRHTGMFNVRERGLITIVDKWTMPAHDLDEV